MLLCASSLHSALCRRFTETHPKGRALKNSENNKSTQERDAPTASPSAEKRFDDKIHVELSQVRVLLACPNEEDGLPGLVTHRQRRAHLSQTGAKTSRGFGTKRGIAMVRSHVLLSPNCVINSAKTVKSDGYRAEVRAKRGKAMVSSHVVVVVDYF